MKSKVFSGHTIQQKAVLFFEAVTLAFGLLGAFFSGTIGFTLNKPLLTPPDAALPVIWTILNLITGFAAYLVWNSFDIDSGKILRLYLLQLLIGALWHLFIFRLEWRLFAFFWMLFWGLLVTLVMAGFRYISKAAYCLMIPYLLWLLYLSYLNLGYYLLNV